MRASLCLALLVAGFVGGCTSDDYTRTEGVTLAAGNAQASNTAMQMVDPWKYGVQNTRLLVPAQRPGSESAVVGAKAGSGPAAPPTSSTTSN
ncbi:hypothetical protein EN828_17235 [Mesorhizobium sp. M2D.F.Ca.ET.185.01.1.1]|uniref:hypothetical protein n=1 Tax=unclassified Mesorhizobium TaxID=325217 RepID=UPI000FCA2D39|nr:MULTISPECIES: hypothetical protein [unclassified Mesorhizobium]TGP79195.1 hypothetical protein EN870_13555 [bacterium M00.F.Ca.ET.227.01.1.1]TGQ01067.1 hypothetical protein EN864_03685 [bacterium M00.F.Ca.ET.221.01.1.1]TGQ02415.1 hypothetical protein EN865_00220 [bacterium M00.F.Ca.ET.222.01.1.1]TGT75617.1 hypothetical protein EN802_05100 [bacterium M00.F.Ca.ET.159.01.1.1]TGT81513.1 hypothetical protein EN800_21850 [bacterium M00.F.Ca.ET.157.01.1.1]TGU12312.1 hypothetical protein EN806_179